MKPPRWYLGLGLLRLGALVQRVGLWVFAPYIAADLDVALGVTTLFEPASRTKAAFFEPLEPKP